jgi:hypothetical protein
VAGGEAGRDLDDAPLPAAGREAAAGEGGDDGVPADPRHRGAVAHAGRRLDVHGEIAAAKESAVADDQACCGLVWVDARGCGA